VSDRDSERTPTGGGALRTALADLGEQAGVYDVLPGAARQARRHRWRVRLAAAVTVLVVLVAGATAVAWGRSSLLSLPQPASSVGPTPTAVGAPGPVVRLPAKPAAPPLRAGMRVGAATLISGDYLWTARRHWYVLPYSTTSNGLERSWAGLSPDGRQLVYRVVAPPGHGGTDWTSGWLVVQDLTTGRTHKITSTAAAVAGWSQNSRWALLFERPLAAGGAAHAVRLDLRSGATVRFDLRQLLAADQFTTEDLFASAGAVRDDGDLVLVRPGPAPDSGGIMAQGGVTVRTVDPVSGRTVATVAIPGVLRWILDRVGDPTYRGPNPPATAWDRVTVWLTGDDERLVVETAGVLGLRGKPATWVPVDTALYDLASGRKLASLRRYANHVDGATDENIASAGHQLTVVIADYGLQYTVLRLAPDGRSATQVAEYATTNRLYLPGQVALPDRP
jgi:hypothetical protein